MQCSIESWKTDSMLVSLTPKLSQISSMVEWFTSKLREASPLVVSLHGKYKAMNHDRPTLFGAMCGVTVVCFPSLPLMLLCGFESRLGLETLVCSMCNFLTLIARGFLRVLQFPPPPSSVNGSANKIKLN